MSAFKSLEKSLDEIFVKNTPPLPSNAKKIIVEYLPYINVVLGILALVAARGLYHAAHTLNGLVANTLGGAYVGASGTDHLPATVWLAVGVLVAEAVLYISAFPATKDRKKSGWDLLFYALLINVGYGVVVAFTDYGGVASLLGSLVGSAIGFYFLFQIRGSYKAKPAVKGPSKKASK